MNKVNRIGENNFYPYRCEFFVNTNNLISEEMVTTILDKLDNNIVEKLNEVLNGIKFYVGGNQRHHNNEEYITSATFEFNLKKRELLFFLFRMFKRGYQRWRESQYGALKRFLWESFFHEIIICFTRIIRLNNDLIRDSVSLLKEIGKSSFDEEILDLFILEDENPPKINYITLGTDLWKEDLPENLGFLNVFHSRKLEQLKKENRQGMISYFLRNKFYNELRKMKLNYEYEYNLSELINYCIYSDHFDPFLNEYSAESVRRKFYYKAKREIKKFFKTYEIKTKSYKDSAGRNHIFISHRIFEKVKSACLQLCVRKIQIETLNRYRIFKDFYSECPICGQDEINQIICEKIYFSNEYQTFKEELVKFLESGKSLGLVNNEEFFFGVPCEECFNFIRDIQGKFSEFNLLQKFILHYSTCPVCGSKNHLSYLLSFFYDDSKEDLKEFLINHMNAKKINNINFNIGIPCCECFEEVFGEYPEYLGFLT